MNLTLQNCSNLIFLEFDNFFKYSIEAFAGRTKIRDRPQFPTPGL